MYCVICGISKEISLISMLRYMKKKFYVSFQIIHFSHTLKNQWSEKEEYIFMKIKRDRKYIEEILCRILSNSE